MKVQIREYSTRYVIAYEDGWVGNYLPSVRRRAILADSYEQALERFDAQWRKFGESVPPRWVESSQSI